MKRRPASTLATLGALAALWLAPAAALALAPAATPAATASATGPEPRFDLAVNHAPAPQVFMQIGHGTPYNVLVSPEVSGHITVALKGTTVLEAMEALRELYGYDYRVSAQRIFVYPNTVQTRLFRINYLPGRRQGASDLRVSSSSITQAGSPGTAGQGAAGGGSTNSSGGNSAGASRADDTSHVRTTSDADFWREVQASLLALVGSAAGRSVVLNPAAGVIVVKATPAEQRQVEQYLKAIQLSIERQVMLEAKIVEVSLSNDAQTGINWGGFGKVLSDKASISIGAVAPGASIGPGGPLSSGDGTSITAGINLAAGALTGGFYGLAFQAANFAALLNFLRTQGDVQVLSSPRIATLNNQKAVLKVGADELYVTGISSTTTTSGSGTVTTPSVTLQPFFSGIALDVTPQIDEAGNVMLHVHPTISHVAEKVKHVDLGALGSYSLPLATSAINETDSIVRVKDGQIVAIGGLMKHESRDEQTGLPGLSAMPLVGALFRQTKTVASKRELVILLKPSVIRDGQPWPEATPLAPPAPAGTSAVAP